jgi:putative salt-induced outer membrane protein YdiY
MRFQALLNDQVFLPACVPVGNFYRLAGLYLIRRISHLFKFNKGVSMFFNVACKALNKNRLKQLLYGLIAMAAWFSGSAVADSVWMKNGDKITGTLVNKITDKVVISTSYAGEIKLNWSDILSIDAEKPYTMMLSDQTVVTGFLKHGENGQAILDEDGKTELVDTELAEIQYINPSKDLIDEGYVWSGNLNLGGTFNNGNSKNRNMQFNGESITRGFEDRYTVQGYAYWAEDNDEQTQNNMRVRGQYDHFFTKKWFTYLNTIQEKDRFRDIRLRSTYGVGTGYQIFEGEKLNLSLEGGLSWIKQDYYEENDENHGALRWAVNYNQYLFDSFVQAFHRHEVLYTPRAPSQILLYSSTGLRFPFILGLSATTQLDYNLDSRPADDRRKGDTRALFTLGYTWK